MIKGCFFDYKAGLLCAFFLILKVLKPVIIMSYSCSIAFVKFHLTDFDILNKLVKERGEGLYGG